MKEWKENKKDLKKEIEKLENTPQENKLKKQALFREYKFSSLLKNLLKISEDFTSWQDERKRATYFNLYIGSKLLEEIGRRKGYTLNQLKYTTGFEIENIFTKAEPSTKELDARMDNSVFVATPKGYYVATGAEVEKVRKIMWGEKKEENIKDFRGLTASLGKVQGRVRIIKSVDEVGNILKGEILVAVMTRPDYVPAMKKAAAIVTNEGGVTSHAAIVSRELHIPCIIGTKIATEVLHNGDLIEVNANHGRVTILEAAPR
jgi:phosphoenolpyruvate synthase/pyruvate phosphate dikinase